LLDYAQVQQVFGFRRQLQNEWKFHPNSGPFKRLTERASVIITKDLRSLLNDSDLHVGLVQPRTATADRIPEAIGIETPNNEAESGTKRSRNMERVWGEREKG
jgi:hypothetical protein